MTGSYFESLEQMSGVVDCFMQGRRNRMSSSAGEDETGTGTLSLPPSVTKSIPKSQLGGIEPKTQNVLNLRRQSADLGVSCAFLPGPALTQQAAQSSEG